MRAREAAACAAALTIRSARAFDRLRAARAFAHRHVARLERSSGGQQPVWPRVEAWSRGRRDDRPRTHQEDEFATGREDVRDSHEDCDCANAENASA